MILVVSLSPAWQRTLFFEHLTLGQVNRARRVIETASGKGVNVARVLHTLGEPTRLLTVAGGQRGRWFCQALAADGLAARIVPMRAETRYCQTLVADGRATELVEEAPALTRAEVAAVVRAVRHELRRARWLVLTGTVPRGCGEDFYGRLTRMARQEGVSVAVDAQGKLLLGAVIEHPSLVKVNRAELCAATGKSDPRTLLRLGSEQVVVTQGPGPVLVLTRSECWKVQPPRVQAVNAIGSGDSMLAGIVAGLRRGWELAEAVRLGVACGAANALTETAGTVRRSDVRRLLRSLGQSPT